MNSPVNSQSQLTTPLGSTTNQTTAQSSIFNRKSLNQLKPIDSVDSVSGLIDGTSLTQSDAKKFSNIKEVDNDDSPKSSKEPSKFEYNFLKNDNDNLSSHKSEAPSSKRPPITPIIKHYENTNKNNNENNSPLTASSISMKVEPHSPTHLRSFKNYDEQNEKHSNNSINNSPNRTNNPTTKFNGNFFKAFFVEKIVVILFEIV